MTPRPASAGPARFAAALLIVLVLAASVPAAAEPSFPPLTGRVVDGAALLSGPQEQQLSDRLEALEDQTTDQVVVVTLPALQGYPVEEFGYKLGRHWGIGQAGKDNGVLLIVAPKERKVRIEVGRGLEGVLPDALAKLIIENAILPRFRAGDAAAGIEAGVRDIAAVLTGDAEAVKLRARDSAEELDDWEALIIVAIWILIIVIVIWSIVHSARQGATGGKGRKSGSGWTFGSGRSSGGRSGGGFSGGGGGFGGGGAGGSW